MKIFYLSISGFCLGFLAGLSLSPVAHIILSFLISIIVGVYVLRPFKESEKESPRLIFFAILCITVGTLIGIYTRVKGNQYFATNKCYHSKLEKEPHNKCEYKHEEDTGLENESGFGLHSGELNNLNELRSSIELGNLNGIRKSLLNAGDSSITDFVDHCNDSMLLLKFANHVMMDHSQKLK